MNDAAPERLFLSPRPTLALALLLLLGSFAQLAYRYTLPTDGWSVYTDEITGSSWRMYSNLVGARSDLQRDDAVLAVDGASVVGLATNAYVPPPAGWRVGQTVTMRVQRGETQLAVTVPVVHWTAKAVWRANALGPLELAGLAGSLGGQLLLAIGWFTFWRRPDVPAARALLLLSTAVGATSISGLLPDGLSVQFNWPAFVLTGFFSYMIFGTVLAPALLTFTLLFPRPKQAIRRRPWLALLPLPAGGLLLLFLLAGGPGEVGWFATLGTFTLSVASLLHAWLTQRNPVSRAQMRWAITGFVAGLGLFMLNFPLSFNWVTQPALVALFYVAQSLGMAVIGAGLAVAVLRYRLYDIDVIIRKTLVYAVLTALLALVYFGSVVLLQSVVGRLTGEQSPLIIVLSTLLIAALFGPLRRRVQAVIDRRFYRQKFDAQQVLTRFAVTARDETDLEVLATELARVVQETLQPAQVGVWWPRRSSRPPPDTDQTSDPL